MSQNNFVNRVKQMADDELDSELMSEKINDIGRHIILQEKTRRTIAKPHAIAWWALGFTAIAAAASVIAAWDVVCRWIREGNQ